VPDATTLLNFRHLLEKHALQQQLFETINDILRKEGMMWQGGSIVDATIIEAPSSTKNSSGSRDPQMKQTKKGNAWHFGMKVHAGADAGTGMTHSVSFTAANVHDITEAHKLVRLDDAFVNGDAGYVGIAQRAEVLNDENLSKIDWRINGRKGKERAREKAIYKNPMNHLEYIRQPQWGEKIEYMKSKVRSKVEHNFYIVKHIFGYRKARDSEERSASLYAVCAGQPAALVVAATIAGFHTRSRLKGAGEACPDAHSMAFGLCYPRKYYRFTMTSGQILP
jgi:IS5 family transposase